MKIIKKKFRNLVIWGHSFFFKVPYELSLENHALIKAFKIHVENFVVWFGKYLSVAGQVSKIKAFAGRNHSYNIYFS